MVPPRDGALRAQAAVATLACRMSRCDLLRSYANTSINHYSTVACTA